MRITKEQLEQLNKFIKCLQGLNDNFKIICEYLNKCDYHSDDYYAAVREGLDFLIDENIKLSIVIKMLKKIWRKS